MLHDFLESGVVLLELLALLFELLLDVFVSNEDTLKIHPLLLHLEPDFDAFCNQIQGFCPVVYFTCEGACVLA